LLLLRSLGQEFVPTLDEKDLAIQALRIPSTALTQSLQMQFQVEKTLSAFPEVAFVFSKTGTAEMAADPMPPNASDTFVMLKSPDQWPDPTAPKSALVKRMEEALEKLPGNAYEFTQPVQLRFNELIGIHDQKLELGAHREVLLENPALKHAEAFVRIGRQIQIHAGLVELAGQVN
jgi:cobalt-zinc-cadmium resistance protein CzcA